MIFYTLGVQGSLSSLVLGHLVAVVLVASCAKGVAGLGNVHLKDGEEEGRRRCRGRGKIPS
jgi:hypothetical protein